MNDVRPVILSGGSGTRLWPKSLESKPKQFLDLLGSGTLYEKTLSRVMAIPGSTRPLAVTGARYLSETQAGAGDLAVDVVLEPQGRNTAAAIVAAALLIPSEHLMVVTPSDHLVVDQDAFVAAVSEAIALARKGGIGTLGVVPDHAETGFGYIQKGEPRNGGYAIQRFVEKPESDVAAELANDSEYLWNAGIFIGTAGRILAEARAYCPDIVAGVEAAIPRDVGSVVRLTDDFLDVPAQPFDKAVMEKTRDGFVVPLDAGWTDVGSWKSVWAASQKDDAGNAVMGRVVVGDVNGSYINASSRPVIVIGLDNVAVVETEDGVLVTTLDRSQELRKLADRLKDRDSGESAG